MRCVCSAWWSRHSSSWRPCCRPFSVFELTGAAPADKPDFIDTIVAFFTWEEGRNPIDFAASALVALGFMALGGVGALLARLADAFDARRTLISVTMVAGAILGTTSQLWWIGVKGVATDPHYCDCGFRAEEITSRLMALRIAGSVQTWLLIGGIVATSIGVLLAVRPCPPRRDLERLGVAVLPAGHRLAACLLRGGSPDRSVRPVRHAAGGRDPDPGLGAVAGDRGAEAWRHPM